MEEIARQFKEELQELLNRYKDKMSTPQIMRIAQPIFTKTIGFKDNPERFIAHPPVTNKWSSEHNTFQEEFRNVEELEGSVGRDAVAGIDLDSSMMHLGGSDA